jgi:hypothetical protein
VCRAAETSGPVGRTLIKSLCTSATCGAIAQLGERLVRNEEAVGSSPTSSTNVLAGESPPWSCQDVFQTFVFDVRSVLAKGCLSLNCAGALSPAIDGLDWLAQLEVVSAELPVSKVIFV